MLRYKCGSELVQVKFTHTYLLKQDPSISKLGARLSLEMPICKHPHMAEISHDSGFYLWISEIFFDGGIIFLSANVS